MNDLALYKFYIRRFAIFIAAHCYQLFIYNCLNSNVMGTFDFIIDKGIFVF